MRIRESLHFLGTFSEVVNLWEVKNLRLFVISQEAFRSIILETLGWRHRERLGVQVVLDDGLRPGRIADSSLLCRLRWLQVLIDSGRLLPLGSLVAHL